MTVHIEEAPAPPPPVKGTRGSGDDRRPPRRRVPSGLVPYLLLAPAVIAILAVLGYALFRNVLISLQEFGRKQLISRTTEWTGLDNYKAVLENERFWDSLVRTFLFMAANVVLIMIIGTLLGLLLNALGKKMRLVLAVSLVAAWAMPVIATTTVFRWLFDTQFGVANWLMRTLGFSGYDQHNWFGSGFSTLTIVTLLIVWTSVPFVALNLYAGLTTVSGEIWEAARMDGASSTRIFWSILLPIMRPFFMITTFLEIIWVFKAFAQIYAMNGGGPDRQSETLPVMAYVEGMGQNQYGMAAAISVLTLVILMIAMSFYFRLILKQEKENS
ncbi:carbohydrate ABC transporter membrane protein 1, CUT1 family [Streptomyces zhaozhouensis]|uniref:Carbohydrate ABC transporter membrane protein 1, CUT1 family n=1 Tax=Streptomyces zhaozhouensis TaxID=1300267 RepID=A0A286DQD6_9ACTN|nr:sugar ABC transporter permease [Streptomyces zhaozhouensis]SOD60843.1 carbohydrate ABC transporter membrane protein 1, CUT1 family [Streptomyces zhaozhouensis]